MDILDGKLNLDDYQAVFVKDKDGRALAISFPIDMFQKTTTCRFSFFLASL